MVFFIIAAKDHTTDDESKVEAVLRQQILGAGPKSNGELYNVDVKLPLHIPQFTYT